MIINLEKKHLTTVLGILALTVPDCEVWAFGSRVGDRGKVSSDKLQAAGVKRCNKYSDLDLVVKARKKIDWKKLEDLKLAMSESDLPIMVDISDYNTLTDSFRKIIEANWVRLR